MQVQAFSHLVPRQELSALPSLQKAIIQAAQEGSPFDLDLASWDINERNEQGQTALQIAIIHKRTDIALQLIQAKASLEAKDDEGNDALFLASYFDEEEVIERIAQKVDLDQPNQEGYTALQVAAMLGNLNALKRLTREGASVSKKWGNSGFSALELAAIAGNLDCLRFLASRISLSTVDFLGKNCLHRLIEEGEARAICSLLDLGLDIEEKDAQGNSPLTLAIKANKLLILRLLIGHKASLEAKDQLGYSPLQTAILEKNEDAVDMLLQAGANVEASNPHNGLKAAHLAAKTANVTIIARLIQAAVRFDSLDHKGACPLDYIHLISKQDLLPPFKLKDYEEAKKMIQEAINKQAKGYQLIPSSP